MFCVHCGSKLPDDANFCSSCGKKVTPLATSQPPQEAPAPNPAPNQNPQDNWEAPKPNPAPKQNPQNNWEAPKPNPAPNPNSWNNWQAPTPKNTAPSGGLNKKILIPAAAAAAVLVLILILVLIFAGGSDDDSKTSKKDSKSSTVQISKDSVKMDQWYDNESFLFSHDEFPQLYADVLKEKDSPFTVGESKYILENGCQWDLLYKGKPAIYFNTTEDPETGKITTVKAGHNGLTAGYEEITREEFDAITYIIEACHGPMSKSDWDIINNADPSLNTDTIKIYDLELDGLTIKITATETTYTVDIYAGEPQTAAPKNNTTEATEYVPDVDPNVIAKFPYGQRRFNSSTFLFTHKEFADLYNLVLMANKPNFSLSEPTALDGGKYHYKLLYQGEKVGFMVVEVNSAGKVVDIAIDYDFDSNEAVAQEGISACLFILKAAHGDMSDSDWSSIFETKATAVRDDYSVFSYDLSGMSAGMLLYSDRLHLNMEIK